MRLILPLLTEIDPEVSSEGSIDPLGLYSIADALATKMIPGVRERQAHPRFLTAMAVGAVVCGDLEGCLASDGVSEPWQVFEWYMVEGLVRCCDSSELTGLPGRDKASTAIRSGLRLSAKRYLKAPKVFGFHGVYRRLAEALDILDDSGAIGVNGSGLLNVWVAEQGLDGFIGSVTGEGRSIKERLVSAVRDGLEKGAVARSASWGNWMFFKDHLLHTNIPKDEAEFLKHLLLNDDRGFRGEVLSFLVSEKGREFQDEKTFSERAFHKVLYKHAGSGLRMLLDAIISYEAFSGLLTDAFFDCLRIMTVQRGKTTISKLAASPYVRKAAEKIPSLYEDLLAKLDCVGLSKRFSDGGFTEFHASMSKGVFVEVLLEHHRKVQKAKSVEGKAPWFETAIDGSVYIRPAYKEDDMEPLNGEYVHHYRMRPLLNFAKDLKMVR